MPYDSMYGRYGSTYSPNSVGGGRGGDMIPYSDESFQNEVAGYGSGSRGAFGGYSTQPARGGGGESGGGGGGMGAGVWGAIIQAIIGNAQNNREAIAAGAAARNSIPGDPSYMKPFLDEIAKEGVQLRDSHLGARPTQEAAALGQRAAASQGLTGPMMAAMQQEAVGQRQAEYDKWRQGALMAHRQMYMDKIREYMQALEARRQAMVAAGYAEREAAMSQPTILAPFGGMGPIGKMFATWGLENNAVPESEFFGTKGASGWSSKELDKRGAYGRPNFTYY